MGAMWAPRAREQGYDPKAVRDATKRDEFILEVTPTDLKGSVIGDPENCTGARCIKHKTKYTWAWIGVSTAILGTENGGLVRFQHSGAIPKKQDEGFFPVGSYRFGAPAPANQIGERNKRRKPGEKGGADKVGQGQAKAKTREILEGGATKTTPMKPTKSTAPAKTPRKKPTKSLAQQFRH